MKQFDAFELAVFVKNFPGFNLLFSADDLPAELNQEYRYDWSTFQKFLKATSTSDFPLVFAVDDFQWVEWTSTKWIFERTNTAGNEGSFFIISYNSDLEDKESIWYREVHNLATEGFDVVEISLIDLGKEATSVILLEMFWERLSSLLSISVIGCTDKHWETHCT